MKNNYVKKKYSRIDPQRSRHIIKKDLLNFSYRLIPRPLKMFPTLQRNVFVLNKSQRAGSCKLPSSHALSQDCSHVLVRFWRPSRVHIFDMTVENKDMDLSTCWKTYIYSCEAFSGINSYRLMVVGYPLL